MVTQLLLLNKRKTKFIPAPLTATTNSANETVTLQSLGVSAATVIDWGDGNTDTLTGTATRTHTYATAGTYDITFDVPTNLTNLTVLDAVFDIHTASIASMVNLTVFYIDNCGGTYRSADIAELVNLTEWLHLRSFTGSVIIDTADYKNMTDLVRFRLIQLPAAAVVYVDVSDISASTIGNFAVQNMEVAPVSDFTFLPDGLRNYNAAIDVLLTNNNLSTAQCDAVIEEFWQQALAGTRTATGGRIDLRINEAITGTIQAPVGSPANAGEKVYELINDSLSNGFNTWTTITVDTA